MQYFVEVYKGKVQRNKLASILNLNNTIEMCKFIIQLINIFLILF